MNVGIIGLGEVGSAIKTLCLKKHSVFARTRTFDEIADHKIDVLHLCYPYTEEFVSAAIQTIKQLNPSLVIIDSTVKPGTTQEIFQQTNIPMVHAPIVGKHPQLYDYLLSMEKIIGPVNEQSYELAKEHFESLGLKTVRFQSSLESELAKVFSTTYYGWNIIFEKYVHNVCQQHGANFEEVYAKMNQVYNSGYEKTLPHVVRPILKHEKGEIGGHCVLPNARIINTWLHDEFSSFLLEQNDKLKDS